MKKGLERIGVFLAIVLLLPLQIQGVYDGDVVSSCSERESKKIAITFDDGPHPRYTPEILDILDEYGVKATFFVIGVNAETYPSLVKAEADAGHELGNHTYSHANLRELSDADVCGEIVKTERLIYETTEHRSRLLRPPAGIYSQQVCNTAANFDYTVVLWSVDTRDWEHTPADEIASHVLSEVQGGDIVLFHDFIGHDSPTPQALRQILPILKDAGYEFVTVSELLTAN